MQRSQKEVEEEFSRLRMADAKDDRTGPDKTSDNPNDTSSTSNSDGEVKLDDTVSADQAAKLKEEGNVSYKSGDYKCAYDKYKRASESAHASDEDRATYLANLAAAGLKLQRWDDVDKAASSALKLNPGYSKALLRRREARERLCNWRGALEDAKTLNAPEAELKRLQYQADQKDKQAQEEALNSLKGLGNSILSNFGMSLDDFAFEKDPDTGSYSVKTKK